MGLTPPCRIDLDAVRTKGYGFEIEMIYRAVAAECSLVEVPITFRDRIAGASKMSGNIVKEAFLLVTWRAITDAVKLRWRRRAHREG